MLRGLYISASGMTSSQTKVNEVSNNLANTTTKGFKEDRNVFKAYPEKELSRTNDHLKESPLGVIDERPDLGPLNMGVTSDGTYTDFSQGSFKDTGNPLDFALDGKGFFTVQLPDGTESYTRSGDFKLNEQGQLVTSQGYQVMGENGPVQIDTEISELNTTPNGQIQNRNGEIQGTLRVVQFENPQKLRKRGDTMFLQGENNQIIEDTQNVQVRDKLLEASNNNPIDSLTEMVRASRRFEMNQRSLKSQDRMLQQAIRQVGRSR